MWVFKRVKNGNSQLSEIYHQFIEETKMELWNSKEELGNYLLEVITNRRD